MKDVLIPTDELEELRAVLAEAGLIKREASIDLLPYQPAFARRSDHRHVHYLVSSRQQPVCHLVAGKNLDRLDANAKAFAAACPKLACRPLFYKAGERTDYLGLEQFSGESLDAAVQSGRYSGTDWLKAVRHAQGLLECTEQQSDPAGLHEEVAELVNNACAFPGFSEVDARLLRDLVQPVLMDTAKNVPLVTHWSTGDFVGRNLLVDAAGDIRLIDYDHARRTHFGRSDWLRLMQFSSLPAGLDPNSVNELNFADRPRHEVYLWLHQLALLREAEHTEITRRHIALTTHQLFAAVNRAIGRKASCLPYSFLLSSLSEHQIETESLLQERTAWAKSLECDLKKTGAALAVQTQVVEERTAWAKSLDAEIQKARSALATQTDLVEERTAWAQSLDQELGSARQNLEKLAVEYAERTTWAQSLDVDLQKARAEHLKQAQAAAELVAEIAAVDKACKALAAFIPGDPEWDRVAIVERSLQILVDLRREVSAKNVATNAAAAATLSAQLASEIAESNACRLAAAVADAQLHVDGLLQHAARLQDSLNRAQATNQETENALREKEHRLSSSIAELQATRQELARYESRLICRLAARPSSLLPARTP